ncbi:endonuclease/exonuclease/phosphatase family protein [Luteolibacter yonseiensis]|uniref:Endonuclease/exonuclease/phosphatase family protein n=1 Tax=Luteolibacter yonseiensis TaxID=1144680 RepID=A0A934R6Q6_9BACT|nr:endonuclease/exonuclease/phosphatase family protein [Luteolibacter yonseiensis]MBK1817979.1 endonuclease/exonuclease/phosphatase family protein [Luteolibacter yonseiensis]
MALAGSACAAPAVSLSKTSYEPGENITVNFSGGPGNTKDWIGIYSPGITPSGNPVSLLWFYTNGTKTASGSFPSGSVTFNNPTLGAGTYGVYFLANDAYGILAGPVTLTIANSTPSTWRTSSIRLRHAVAGTAYSAKISAFATPATVRSFTKVEGPSWLNVSAAGVISGTPGITDAGIQTARIRLAGAAGVPTADIPLTFEVFPAGQEHISRLKVMSYNVWKEWSQVKDGFQKGVNSILQADADIVGLQESSATQAQALADELGWYRATSGTGSTQVVSRYPIVENFNAGIGVGARIRVATSPERDMVMLNCHLDYLYYGPYAARVAGATPQSVLAEEARSARDTQMAAVLQAMTSRLAAADQLPVVLTGDFNVPSHLDWTAATASSHGGVGPVAWPVSTRIHAAGLLDSFRIAHPDPASDPANSWSSIHKGTEAQDRIDFIYYKGKALRVLDSEMFATAVETKVGAWGTDVTPVLNNTWPSDHFSMVTTYALASADTDGNGVSDAWEQRWFQSLGSIPQGDANNDGLSNRTSMLLGLPPVGASGHAVEFSPSATSAVPDLSFHVSDLALGNGLRLQRSENLTQWTTVWSFDEDPLLKSPTLSVIERLFPARWKLHLRNLPAPTNGVSSFYRLSHF